MAFSNRILNWFYASFYKQGADQIESFSRTFDNHYEQTLHAFQQKRSWSRNYLTDNVFF